MLSLGRPDDMFSDESIQLRPILSNFLSSHLFSTSLVSKNFSLSLGYQGTADFLIHHIHAFTIHVTILIILKSILFGRSSRLLILDKIELGFRYPCDGPGRGGTCQVSGLDHTFLALYWMYNTISVVCFHYVWKLQSDLWAIVKFNLPSLNFVDHITGSELSNPMVHLYLLIR